MRKSAAFPLAFLVVSATLTTWGAAAPAAGRAAPVRSTPAPPPAPALSKVTYEILADGQPLGSEEVTFAAPAAGRALSGTVRIKLPGGGNGAMTQEARFAPGGALSSYRLDVDIPGQQVTISVTPAPDGFTAAVLPKGGTTPLETRAIPAKPPVVLADNSFASHLDLLTRALGDLGPGQERPYTFLVPQVLGAIPGTVKRLADGKGTLDGAPVDTRSYRVTVANVAEELTARASDGALLRIEVPMQKLVISRSGYATAPSTGAQAPAADPRETLTTLKGPAGELPAVLLVPESKQPVAGVVFLSGSGPNDRDETIGPNKPFLEIARALGNRGIASLRFDKRTRALPDKAKPTLAAEYFEDAAAAIRMLAATRGVDPKRLFLLGHSEGAMLAPSIAAESGGVRGLLLLAPGARPLDATVVDQMENSARLAGRSEAEIAEQSRQLWDDFAVIRDASRTDAPALLGAPASYWREVLAVDVPESVRASKLPILILQGDKDCQIRKDLDFDVLRSRVGPMGGRVTYRSFPGLNHLFMPVEGVSTGAEYGVAGHVDAAVPAAIADWILAH